MTEQEIREAFDKWISNEDDPEDYSGSYRCDLTSAFKSGIALQQKRIEELTHDIERHIKIAAEQATEIEELKESTRWIPVSEKLPDKSCWLPADASRPLGRLVEVLARTESGKVMQTRYTALGWANVGSDNVTHWRPMPIFTGGYKE